MPLPDHISDMIFGGPATQDEIADWSIPVGEFGILYSEASREQLLELSTNPFSGKVEIRDVQKAVTEWRYREVLDSSGALIAEMLQLPEGDVNAPPTNAEKLMIKAWSVRPDFVDAATRRRLQNRLLIISYDNKFSDTLSEFSYACFNGSQPVTRRYAMSAELASRMQIGAEFNSRRGSDLRRKLYAIALQEHRLQSQFLALYRIIESGYLEAILQKLNDEFMENPEQCLSSAMKEVGAEREQLCTLIEKKNITHLFDVVPNIIEGLLKKNNRFAHALKRDISRTIKDERLAWRRGAAWVYKVRCAIVHAGGGIIIENFADADDVVEALLPTVEKTAAEVLGVNFLDN